MFEKGQIGIVGGVYNIENGEVDFFKNLTKKRKEDKMLANA
jgi:carbonic anhydrase